MVNVFGKVRIFRFINNVISFSLLFVLKLFSYNKDDIFLYLLLQKKFVIDSRVFGDCNDLSIVLLSFYTRVNLSSMSAPIKIMLLNVSYLIKVLPIALLK